MNLDTLLHDTAHVGDPSPAALGRGLAALPAAPAARRRGLRHAAVAAMAAAAVVVPVVALDGGQPAESAAAAVLNQAAVAAGQQQGGWPDAAYWHSVSQYVRNGVTVHREIWIAHDGTSVLRDPLVRHGLIPLGNVTFWIGGSRLTWDQLYALPTNPAALAADLRRRSAGALIGSNAELFQVAGDLLRESPASPALRAALYQVAAGIPGVRSEGTVTDRAGRTGAAIERDGDTYVIDTSTGRLLQESDGLGWTSTYLSQGPATSEPSS